MLTSKPSETTVEVLQEIFPAFAPSSCLEPLRGVRRVATLRLPSAPSDLDAMAAAAGLTQHVGDRCWFTSEAPGLTISPGRHRSTYIGDAMIVRHPNGSAAAYRCNITMEPHPLEEAEARLAEGTAYDLRIATIDQLDPDAQSERLALLMPEPMFRLMAPPRYRATDIAEAFKVPVQAVWFRAADLEITLPA